MPPGPPAPPGGGPGGWLLLPLPQLSPLLLEAVVSLLAPLLWACKAAIKLCMKAAIADCWVESLESVLEALEELDELDVELELLDVLLDASVPLRLKPRLDKACVTDCIKPPPPPPWGGGPGGGPYACMPDVSPDEELVPCVELVFWI